MLSEIIVFLRPAPKRLFARSVLPADIAAARVRAIASGLTSRACLPRRLHLDKRHPWIVPSFMYCPRFVILRYYTSFLYSMSATTVLWCC